MASEDGQEGMKLDDFIKMWTADGTKLVEQERRIMNGATWILYAVYFSDSTYEYGRHMGMLLKVDTETEVILLHDLRNLSGDVTDSYRQGIDDWFESHVGHY